VTPIEEVSMLMRIIRDEEGQDMIEYGILAAFISVAAVIAIKAIGPLVDALYVVVQTALT
jgi:Flp pilus assembly pilin Flp